MAPIRFPGSVSASALGLFLFSRFLSVTNWSYNDFGYPPILFTPSHTEILLSCCTGREGGKRVTPSVV